MTIKWIKHDEMDIVIRNSEDVSSAATFFSNSKDDVRTTLIFTIEWTCDMEHNHDYKKNTFIQLIKALNGDINPRITYVQFHFNRICETFGADTGLDFLNALQQQQHALEYIKWYHILDNRLWWMRLPVLSNFIWNLQPNPKLCMDIENFLFDANQEEFEHFAWSISKVQFEKLTFVSCKVSNYNNFAKQVSKGIGRCNPGYCKPGPFLKTTNIHPLICQQQINSILLGDHLQSLDLVDIDNAGQFNDMIHTEDIGKALAERAGRLLPPLTHIRFAIRTYNHTMQKSAASMPNNPMMTSVVNIMKDPWTPIHVVVLLDRQDNHALTTLLNGIDKDIQTEAIKLEIYHRYLDIRTGKFTVDMSVAKNFATRCENTYNLKCFKFDKSLLSNKAKPYFSKGLLYIQLNNYDRGHLLLDGATDNAWIKVLARLTDISIVYEFLQCKLNLITQQDRVTTNLQETTENLQKTTKNKTQMNQPRKRTKLTYFSTQQH